MVPAQPNKLLAGYDTNSRGMRARRFAPSRYGVNLAEALPGTLDRIRKAYYDLVLLDQMMPGMNGFNLLQLLRATQSSSDLPFPNRREGAQDCVSKPEAPIIRTDQPALPVFERIALARDMCHAIERGQLEAFYQPKVNLRTRAIVGFEALLRWHHPERGMIEPGDFIPLAEETGLIVPIGEWVLEKACYQLKTWQSKFPNSQALNMNVNLSVKQLGDPHLLEHVRAVLDESGLPAGTLKLELTETALMSDVDSAKKVLQRLQALNVGLKLDDFGTGFSSLGYLRALHFDSVKIDRSFVMRMADDANSHAIVQSIMTLARALDMSVVAEGIEQESHATELMRLGCHTGQGFLFSKPVPAWAAEELIASRRRVLG